MTERKRIELLQDKCGFLVSADLDQRCTENRGFMTLQINGIQYTWLPPVTDRRLHADRSELIVAFSCQPNQGLFATCRTIYCSIQSHTAAQVLANSLLSTHTVTV